MKYLLTAALVVLLLWPLYRRLRPYIQLVRQVVRALTGTPATRSASQSPSGLRRDGESSERKLVRCAECATWIPMNRALRSNADLYCSDACLLQAPKVKKRKAAR